MGASTPVSRLATHAGPARCSATPSASDERHPLMFAGVNPTADDAFGRFASWARFSARR
jgi:hypothetical protein